MRGEASRLVASYKQESASKVSLLQIALTPLLSSALFVFVPQWLLPASTRYSRISIKSKAASQPPLELLVVKSALTEVTQLTLNPSLLSQLLLFWRHAYQKTVTKAGAASPFRQEKSQFVVVQAGFFPAHSAMRLRLEMNRFVEGERTALAEVMRHVYVFWNAEREQRFGYLPLSPLVSAEVLEGVSLLPETERARCTEFMLRDESGETLKSVTQGVMRCYKVKAGSVVKAVYSVSVAESVHQM